MSIGSIEIMCISCSKCEQLKAKIPQIIRQLEIQYKTKITYSVKHTPHLRNLANYALNPTQTPVVLINGNVEFAGSGDVGFLKAKLESLHKQSTSQGFIGPL